MATTRTVVAQALRAIRALGPGDDPSIDEINVGAEAIAEILLDLHNSWGLMSDVDVTADYVAAENQRVRIQIGFTVTVMLPNSVSVDAYYDPYDYGFVPITLIPQTGFVGQADGIQYRQPRDGSRVEIVGTTQGLFFYRADTNNWYSATGFGIDDELPLNNRYTSALAALVAERLMDVWPGAPEPTPGLAKRIAKAGAALMLRFGVARDGTAATYF